VSKTEQLVADVLAAGGRLTLPDETGSDGVNWRQRAYAAQRSGKVPSGKHLSVMRTKEGFEISLVDGDTGNELGADPVPVPSRLSRYHRVVLEFRSRTTATVGPIIGPLTAHHKSRWPPRNTASQAAFRPCDKPATSRRHAHDPRGSDHDEHERGAQTPTRPAGAHTATAAATLRIPSRGKPGGKRSPARDPRGSGGDKRERAATISFT